MPITGSRIPPYGGVTRRIGGGAYSGACIGASYVTIYAEGCLPNETTHSGIMHSGAYGGLGTALVPNWTDGYVLVYNAASGTFHMASGCVAPCSGVGAPVGASYVTVNAEAGLTGETTHSGIMHSGAYGGLGHLLNPTWTNGFTIQYNAGANRWDMVSPSGAQLSGYHSDWLSGVDGGRITFNGDGSGVQFVIPHTLTRNLTVNDTYHVTPASSGAAGDFYVTLSGAGGALLVNYKTAPASGTNNVVMQWGIMKLRSV